MNKIRVFVLIIISAVVLVFMSYIAVQANAEKQAEDRIAERLTQQGVPVVNVKTLSRFPYKIEIGLQSSSENNHLTVNDNWPRALARREATFAFKYGSSIEGLSIKFYNKSGEEISSEFEAIHPVEFKLSKSKLSNKETEEIVAELLDFGEYSIKKLEVIDADKVGSDGQILLIELTTLDKEAIKRSEGEIYYSILQLRDSINREFGTSIVLAHVRLADNEGNIIGDLVYDAEVGPLTSIGVGLVHVTGPPDPINKKSTAPVIETTPVVKPYPPPEGEQPAEGVPLLQGTAYPYP